MERKIWLQQLRESSSHSPKISIPTVVLALFNGLFSSKPKADESSFDVTTWLPQREEELKTTDPVYRYILENKKISKKHLMGLEPTDEPKKNCFTKWRESRREKQRLAKLQKEADREAALEAITESQRGRLIEPIERPDVIHIPYVVVEAVAADNAAKRHLAREAQNFEPIERPKREQPEEEETLMESKQSSF
eukprot:Blabericola_migrator_1__3243@NODE_1955_length_3504_cov_301_731452_g1246_i0_p2_GENE_NODE_1955_length_3504_cov_301_731452_g1246_i0NODE_1955_length_3504_cov_301_731452_g1246_i0_p2_ORF_typecomplete_len193_score34_05_NODE_1955_length_3504_cov_301_731452_g1246_i0260838